jgi:hypothetical protein
LAISEKSVSYYLQLGKLREQTIRAEAKNKTRRFSIVKFCFLTVLFSILATALE